jgi:hypothetical protein
MEGEFLMQKTFQKLKTICEPYGVTFDYHYDTSFGEWNITFDAPLKMCWGTSQATVVYYEGTLKSVIGYIKKELEGGFYKADEEALRITGQLDD